MDFNENEITNIENIQEDFPETGIETEGATDEEVKSESIPENVSEPFVIISDEPKKEKKSYGFWKTAVLCLVCGIIGGVCVFLFGLFFGDKQTAEPSENVIEHKEITINADSVSSPATAVSEKVLPSIAGIRVTVEKEVSSWFFGTQKTESTSEGSGIIYSEDGYIITNYHVVEGALTSAGEKAANATLNVFLYENSSEEIGAEIVGYDISSDLAVLKIDKKGLTPIEIGDSDSVNQGDITIAVGNPGGLQFMGSVSQGIISGLNRSLTVESDTYKDVSLIQTDAAINPGNSGGALVDVSGKLIGVNSVKLVSDGYEGMGFAIPVNYVVTVVEDIIKNKDAVHVYLGIEEDTNYTAELLEKNGYPGGVVVKSVASGSPAELGGIEEYDIIVSFNGETVRTMNDINQAKQKCAPGDTVEVRVYRAGRFSGNYYDLKVTLA